jgi:hypothetical protein
MKTTTKTYYESTEFGDFPTSKVVEHTHNDDSRIKELEAKNDELEKKLEIAVEALSESWKLLENSEHCKYANKAYYIVDNALSAINREGMK